MQDGPQLPQSCSGIERQQSKTDAQNLSHQTTVFHDIHSSYANESVASPSCTLSHEVFREIEPVIMTDFLGLHKATMCGIAALMQVASSFGTEAIRENAQKRISFEDIQQDRRRLFLGSRSDKLHSQYWKRQTSFVFARRGLPEVRQLARYDSRECESTR